MSKPQKQLSRQELEEMFDVLQDQFRTACHRKKERFDRGQVTVEQAAAMRTAIATSASALLETNRQLGDIYRQENARVQKPLSFDAPKS